jgi:hypothetical protein
MKIANGRRPQQSNIAFSNYTESIQMHYKVTSHIAQMYITLSPSLFLAYLADGSDHQPQFLNVSFQRSLEAIASSHFFSGCF